MSEIPKVEIHNVQMGAGGDWVRLEEHLAVLRWIRNKLKEMDTIPLCSETFDELKEQIDERLETCSKCNGRGSYMYDEHHIKPCEVCCPHTGGFWLLEEHYGDKNGKWCCKMGCGYTQENEE